MLSSFENESGLALHNACDDGDLTRVQTLSRENSCTPSFTRFKDTEGMSPIMRAVRRGHLEVAKWLFEADAREDIRAPNNEGITPMMMACLQGHLDIAKWLFENGAAADIRDNGHCSRGSPL